MPRQARKKSEFGIYHVMLRGINQQQIFFDDEDYCKFIDLLKKYKAMCGFTLYAYCLMGNHIHLLIRVNDVSLEQIIKRLGGSFACWYNVKYERIGHLFQDRFKSEPVEDRTYFLTVLRYILWNPIKAGICKKPDEYAFSSGKEYICGIPGVTDVKSVKDAVGQTNLLEYLQEKPSYQIKSVNGKVRKHCTDTMAKELIQKEFGTLFPNPGKSRSRDWFNHSIRNLNEKGVSIRQLSRLTGISKRVIERAIVKG